MSYVIRCDKLERPVYFCALAVVGVGFGVIYSDIIMNAWGFDDRAEAERLIAEALGSDWTVSEISAGASSNLAEERI